MELLKRNCEKCGGTYATGKNYGDYWCELSLAKETKGLCEFCNPKSEWFITDEQKKKWNPIKN